jgi:hypothetical protein
MLPASFHFLLIPSFELGHATPALEEMLDSSISMYHFRFAIECAVSLVTTK